MICLTGDVHQDMNSSDQSHVDESEAQIANEYLEIAQSYGIKVTLFITGKTFVSHWEDVKELLKFGNLEIGGHTWSAFYPKILHAAFHKLTGSVYGPAFYQDWDIKRTISIIEKKTGKRPVSWRTHSYLSDNRTFMILEKHGIKVILDEVNKKKLKPTKIGNLISLPINVMPDHEHIYHGERSEEHVNDLIKKGWVDSFTNKSYTIQEYYEIAKSQIEEIERKNGLATILLHPICMKIADNFKTFGKLCEFICNYETIWTSDVLTIGEVIRHV